MPSLITFQSFNCDTACSSSLATIQAACTALWAGDVDTVVAGGLNVLNNCDAFAGLCNGHFITKTPNACKTWDSEADGYCRADGIGSVVLKRLEDAEVTVPISKETVACPDICQHRPTTTTYSESSWLRQRIIPPTLCQSHILTLGTKRTCIVKSWQEQALTHSM